jgi:mRNA interferase RelE/StbE
MKSIQLSKKAAKFLENAHPKHKQQLALKVLSLQNDPTPSDSKQLKGSAYLRVDFGEYRIIYQDTPTSIQILLIGKRNDDDIYKRFDRLNS